MTAMGVSCRCAFVPLNHRNVASCWGQYQPQNRSYFPQPPVVRRLGRVAILILRLPTRKLREVKNHLETLHVINQVYLAVQLR